MLTSWHKLLSTSLHLRWTLRDSSPYMTLIPNHTGHLLTKTRLCQSIMLQHTPRKQKLCHTSAPYITGLLFSTFNVCSGRWTAPSNGHGPSPLACWHKLCDTRFFVILENNNSVTMKRLDCDRIKNNFKLKTHTNICSGRTSRSIFKTIIFVNTYYLVGN